MKSWFFPPPGGLQLAALLLAVLVWALPLQAQGILIHSTSHNNLGTTELTAPSGTLVVEVNSLDPIEEIRFNGEKIAFKGRDATALRLPFRVGPGYTELEVEVITGEGSFEKRFPVVFGQAPKGKKDPLRLTLMGGLNYSSNVASVPDDQAEGGMWADVVFLPGYRFDLGGSALDLAGIFLWEKYLDSDQAQQEVVLSQVSAGYKNPGLLGKWTLDGGYRNFGTQNDGLTAQSDEGSETFFGGKGPVDWGVPLLVGATFTQRTLTNGGSEGYDPNGNLYQVRADWQAGAQGAYGGLDLMDAQGQYKDYAALRLGYSFDLKLSQTMGATVGYDLKKTDYSASDPSYGKAESDLRHSLSGRGTYKITSMPGLTALGEAVYETRSSNVDARQYSAFLLKASALYSF